MNILIICGSKITQIIYSKVLKTVYLGNILNFPQCLFSHVIFFFNLLIRFN